MRSLLFLFTTAVSSIAIAAPPHVESPANPQALRNFGQGSSDEAMANAIAAANAHPPGPLKNPIRVAGPDGAYRYINQLRCADNSTPTPGRESPGGIGAFGTLTTFIT